MREKFLNGISAQEMPFSATDYHMLETLGGAEQSVRAAEIND